MFFRGYFFLHLGIRPVGASIGFFSSSGYQMQVDFFKFNAFKTAPSDKTIEPGNGFYRVMVTNSNLLP
jgi:hypothetical protein